MKAEHSQTIDWQAAKERIDALRHALEQAETYSPSRASAILAARARRLARVVDAVTDDSDTIEIMWLTVGDEAYGLETEVIREVIRPAALAILPGTDAVISGVMNLRGRPLLIVDGRILLGLDGQVAAPAKRVVVVGRDDAEFGLLVDATREVARVHANALAEPPRSLPDATRRLLRGVTREATIVLATDALMSDSRLWIDQRAD